MINNLKQWRDSLTGIQQTGVIAASTNDYKKAPLGRFRDFQH
ncbi:hypothetical protein RJP56_10565 [Shewanella baltica]|nr:hypothetical protein [Shewanella baltica]MDR9766495.1 hypothetical protein [Shewanella baltica]